MKAKMTLSAILSLVVLMLGGGMAFAHHNDPPTPIVLPAGLGTIYGSQETRHNSSTGVDCAYGTVSHKECYDTYAQTQNGSGGNANTPIFKGAIGENAVNKGIVQSGVPQLGTVTFAGVKANNAGLPTGTGRYWTGADVTNLGSLSVAAGGAASGPGGKPFGCVMVFAADKTQGKTLAGALYTAGVSDDSSDHETDIQVCGRIL